MAQRGYDPLFNSSVREVVEDVAGYGNVHIAFLDHQSVRAAPEQNKLHLESGQEALDSVEGHQPVFLIGVGLLRDHIAEIHKIRCHFVPIKQLNSSGEAVLAKVLGILSVLRLIGLVGRDTVLLCSLLAFFIAILSARADGRQLDGIENLPFDLLLRLFLLYLPVVLHLLLLLFVHFLNRLNAYILLFLNPFLFLVGFELLIHLKIQLSMVLFEGIKCRPLEPALQQSIAKLVLLQLHQLTYLLLQNLGRKDYSPLAKTHDKLVDVGRVEMEESQFLGGLQVRPDGADLLPYPGLLGPKFIRRRNLLELVTDPCGY